MMPNIEKRLENIKAALELVETQPMRFTELKTALSRTTGSDARSQGIIDLAIRLKYLDRPKRGVYRITEKGNKILAGLRNPKKEGG